MTAQGKLSNLRSLQLVHGGFVVDRSFRLPPPPQLAHAPSSSSVSSSTGNLSLNFDTVWSTCLPVVQHF